MRITRDDDRARRICSLALAFMNVTSPIPSSEVARRFYPELSADSFRRAFSRDREVLAACGIHLCEGPRAEEATWKADEVRSFAGELDLEPSEAAVIEIACQPLLEDPEFPLATDLRFALAKLTRTFAFPTPTKTGSERRESRVAAAVRDATLRGRGLLVTYTNAAGTTSERTLAPYGIFALRGVAYLVADTLMGPSASGTKTYRVDRMDAARVLDDVPVLVPEDFSVADWRRLPFQLGPSVGRATFEVPPMRSEELRRDSLGKGAFRESDGTLLWDVEYSDADAAARWAVAHGIRPLSPDDVARAARDILEGAAHAS